MVDLSHHSNKVKSVFCYNPKPTGLNLLSCLLAENNLIIYDKHTSLNSLTQTQTQTQTQTLTQTQTQTQTQTKI